jgi:hypothetical protein
MPHVCLICIREDGAAMRSRRVLIHRPRRMGAAVAVLAAELQCGGRVFTTQAREPGQSVDHRDRVMSYLQFSLVASPVKAPNYSSWG